MVAAYAGKRILITGAGGSIGSELALQLSKAGPAALLLLDKDENGLNDTYSHLEKDARARASAVVADLRFVERLHSVLQTFGPEVVFHAAAHKHQISEVLMDNTSDLRPTSIEKIKAISTGAFAFEVFAQRVRALERSAWEGDTDEVYRHLANLNVGYNARVPARPWPTAASRVVPVPTVSGTLAPELS